MKEEILRINSMLLSSDYEMRELGRQLIIPTTKSDIWGRIFLLLNSGKIKSVNEGLRLFLALKKTTRNYFGLLHYMKEYGYRECAIEKFHTIDIVYKRTKKLKVLEDDVSFEEFRKDVPSVKLTSYERDEWRYRGN